MAGKKVSRMISLCVSSGRKNELNQCHPVHLVPASLIMRQTVYQERNHVFKVGVGVQCLGVGYCTEQNADGIPSFVHCRLLRNGNHTLHQKSWGGPPKFFFGGWVPPTPPQWLCPCCLRAIREIRNPKPKPRKPTPARRGKT